MLACTAARPQLFVVAGTLSPRAASVPRRASLLVRYSSMAAVGAVPAPVFPTSDDTDTVQPIEEPQLLTRDVIDDLGPSGGAQ